MDFEWDDNKRAKNIANHGLDFADAEMMDWAGAVIREDDRKDYGERRYWAFGEMDSRMYAVTFVIRSGKIRIINFRHANWKEVDRYGKA